MLDCLTQVLVQSLRYSRQAATHGSASMWLLACEGCAERLGQVGVVEALADTLKEAVVEKELSHLYVDQAVWACAALWRLAYVDEHVPLIFHSSAQCVLTSIQQGKHQKLRNVALGVMSQLMRKSELLGTTMQQSVAPSVMMKLAQNTSDASVEQRLTATRTLDEVSWSLTEIITMGRANCL